MKLLVGLGNPGAEYAQHRHNVGFMAIDRIAEHFRLPAWRRKFSAFLSEGEVGDRVVLLKPQTYMNDSGRAVQEAARFYKLGPADIVVFHDELDLVQGRVRVKTGGGNAGHNGLRSLSAHIGNDYVRVRIGIGHPGAKELVHNWVLGNFAKADRVWVEPLLDAVAKAAPRLVAGAYERFQTDVAQATSTPPSGSSSDKPARSEVKDTTGAAPEAIEKAPQTAFAERLRTWLSDKARKPH